MLDAASILGFVSVSSLVFLVSLVAGRKKTPTEHRLEQLSAAAPLRGGRGSPALGRWGPGKLEGTMDTVAGRAQQSDEQPSLLRTQLDQAGIYAERAIAVFTVVRSVLMVAPLAAGFVAAHLGWMSMRLGLLLGGAGGIAGMLAPGFWLAHRKRARQTSIRRALPDALDVMVICLEGGLSFVGAIARVARELATAHPALAVELNIVARQVRMGSSVGHALREMARRFDLEELRSMASVVIQSERLGSSVVGALTVFAETLRVRRHQRAEELGHKASVKMIFPTLLCIFPAVLVVVLGPAAINIYEQLIKDRPVMRASK